MIALVRGNGRFLSRRLPWHWGSGSSPGSSAKSDDGGPANPGQFAPIGVGTGTLGWGPPGYYPGFQGFGLSFHRGYGYGGAALGVGAEGGYPFYGGPGYPHPWPHLQRCGGIAPVAYYDGTGYPFTFQLPGPLVVTEPVAMQASGHGLGHADGGALYPYNIGYGAFTGNRNYPESFFAPYTVAAAMSGSYVGGPGAAPSATANVDQVRGLGIDEEPAVDVDGVRGMKVSRVYPGTPAEKAGLKRGDVIRSINGYRTEEQGNLAWIMANAAPDKVLKMIVRTPIDAKVHTITVELP